jgi:hypothetical protein
VPLLRCAHLVKSLLGRLAASDPDTSNQVESVLNCYV